MERVTRLRDQENILGIICLISISSGSEPSILKSGREHGTSPYLAREFKEIGAIHIPISSPKPPSRESSGLSELSQRKRRYLL